MANSTNLGDLVDKHLTRLNAANRLARKTGMQADREAYLLEVLRSAIRLAGLRSMGFLADAFGVSPPTAEAMVDALITRTSADDRRTKWTHSSALKYALAKGTPPERLFRFIGKRGGLKACASRMARLRRKASA